mgnify:CR=1 FL=1
MRWLRSFLNSDVLVGEPRDVVLIEAVLAASKLSIPFLTLYLVGARGFDYATAGLFVATRSQSPARGPAIWGCSPPHSPSATASVPGSAGTCFRWPDARPCGWAPPDALLCALIRRVITGRVEARILAIPGEPDRPGSGLPCGKR